MEKILLLGTVLFVGLSGCQHLIPNQEHQISITKPLGTTQCSDTDPTTELKKHKAVLEQANIQVYSAEIGTDGMSHIALCGTADGKIAIFNVNKTSLLTVQSLGYKQIVMD